MRRQCAMACGKAVRGGLMPFWLPPILSPGRALDLVLARVPTTIGLPCRPSSLLTVSSQCPSASCRLWQIAHARARGKPRERGKRHLRSCAQRAGPRAEAARRPRCHPSPVARVQGVPRVHDGRSTLRGRTARGAPGNIPPGDGTGADAFFGGHGGHSRWTVPPAVERFAPGLLQPFQPARSRGRVKVQPQTTVDGWRCAPGHRQVLGWASGAPGDAPRRDRQNMCQVLVLTASAGYLS